MKPWKTIESEAAPGGAQLVLQERDGEFVIRVDGQVLMSSRRHTSEDALAHAARAVLTRPKASVLIGGLGLGYTLRAVLDLVGPEAEVHVAELSSAVVRWNRTVLAPLAGSPLDDSRVTVHEGDVSDALKDRRYDAILLDVDNGPAALTSASNRSLYSERGVGRCRDALKRGGLLVVWSAGPDAPYLARLGRGGFDAEQVPVKAHAGSRSQHVLFVGKRS